MNSQTIVHAALAIAATIAASAAQAQNPAASISSRLAAHQMAACLHDSKSAQTRMYLLASTKREANDAMEQVSGERSCFNAFIRGNGKGPARAALPNGLLRGLLAEQALRRSPGVALGLAALPLQRIYQRPWFEFTGRHSSVDEMATCIADTNPQAVGRLMQTAPASRNESAAISAMQGSIVQCLRAGTTLQADRQSLRAAVAEALFQRLHARAASSAEASR